MEKPPKRSGLESKFLCSMIWIATGLIPSSVNWAFTCYRNNQRKINRHLKMFLLHPFLNIWYLLNDILGDILSETLSDSCSSASDYLRQTWYHCSFGFTRKSFKCLANIAGLFTFLSNANSGPIWQKRLHVVGFSTISVLWTLEFGGFKVVISTCEIWLRAFRLKMKMQCEAEIYFLKFTKTISTCIIEQNKRN